MKLSYYNILTWFLFQSALTGSTERAVIVRATVKVGSDVGETGRVPRAALPAGLEIRATQVG